MKATNDDSVSKPKAGEQEEDYNNVIEISLRNGYLIRENIKQRSPLEINKGINLWNHHVIRK